MAIVRNKHKTPPKKIGEKTKVEITRGQFRAVIRETKTETIMQMMILSAACLMDRYGFTTDDQVLKWWGDISFYSEAVIEEKAISVQKVCDILKENLGLDIHYNAASAKAIAKEGNDD